MRERVEIGRAQGRIALYLDETDAREHLDIFEERYGPNDEATKELRDAIERAYPPPEPDE